MFKAKSGTNVYKAVCAVIFILFSFVYLFYYQTDVLAAAQHIASGGKTHYEPVLGTVLLIIALKLLQNGIQAIAKLKRIFYILTYFPSFLLLALITDIPSRQTQEISFGAWSWALPLSLLAWIFLVYLARQYQPVEVNARDGGLLSQVVGVNLTIMLAMMMMTCLIGNHNRLFHRQMCVESLISRGEFKKAQTVSEKYYSDNPNILILRAYSLSQQRKIGDELFNVPMEGVKSIIPTANGFYSVIVPKDNLTELYKRNVDWQLCEMLVQKKLNEFYDNLVFFYNLDNSGSLSDSTSVNSKNTKAVAKQNAYKDSIMSVRYKKLPRHYQEALVLYNYINRQNIQGRLPIKANYFNEHLLASFQRFLSASDKERKKKYADTYWSFYMN